MDRKPLLWILTVAALAAGWQLASAQVEKGEGVQKWEYQALSGGNDKSPDDESMKALNKLGEEGWELVAVEPASAYGVGTRLGHSFRVFHLKRLK